MFTAFLVVGIAASQARAATIFNVDRPAGPGADYTRDLILQSVQFGDGSVANSSQFVYPSSVTGFTWNGDRDRIRTVSGSNTTGTTGFHRMEAEDGNRYNITSTDMQLFNNRIQSVFNNNNLNNFLDIVYTDARPYSYTIHFNQALVDANPTTDAVGELLYFERGLNGSNSYVLLQATDASGNLIGHSYLVDPTGSEQPTPLHVTGGSTSGNVPTFSVDGVEVGQETMEGLSIDLSSAFGVSSLYGIRVSSPTLPFNGEYFPDLKFIAVQTALPEPATIGLLAITCGSLLLRRKRR